MSSFSRTFSRVGLGTSNADACSPNGVGHNANILCAEFAGDVLIDLLDARHACARGKANRIQGDRRSRLNAGDFRLDVECVECLFENLGLFSNHRLDLFGEVAFGRFQQLNAGKFIALIGFAVQIFILGNVGGPTEEFAGDGGDLLSQLRLSEASTRLLGLLFVLFFFFPLIFVLVFFPPTLLLLLLLLLLLRLALRPPTPHRHLRRRLRSLLPARDEGRVV